MARVGTCAARVGGDEFALMFPGLASSGEATRIAERLLGVFRGSFSLDGQEFQSTASIGLAVYPGDGEDPRTLLRNADAAMYWAKQQGGNDYRRYGPAGGAEAAEGARPDLLSVA